MRCRGLHTEGDDARFTLELARTAAAHGAHVANRVAMTGFLRADASDPQSSVIGVTARDQMTGEEFTIRARRVICATGVWTGEVQSMLGEDIAPLKVRASKGIHLVVPRDRIDSQTGVILRTEKSVLFIIPWDEHWIIGTTDTEWTLDLAHPVQDVAFRTWRSGSVPRRTARTATRIVTGRSRRPRAHRARRPTQCPCRARWDGSG